MYKESIMTKHLNICGPNPAK